MSLHWHRWSVWGKPFMNPNYALPRQQRTCSRCGKVQDRSTQ